MATLKGRALHRLSVDGASVTDDQALLSGRYGRLRAVVEAPDGTFWVTTSNRDSYGSPVSGDDDRILRVVPPRGLTAARPACRRSPAATADWPAGAAGTLPGAMPEQPDEPRDAPVSAPPRPEPHVIVLFGATGDLARRKLLPGLFHLSDAGLLPEDYRVIGTSLDDVDDAGFRDLAREALDEFARVPIEDDAWGAFAERLSYVPEADAGAAAGRGRGRRPRARRRAAPAVLPQRAAGRGGGRGRHARRGRASPSGRGS